MSRGDFPTTRSSVRRLSNLAPKRRRLLVVAVVALAGVRALLWLLPFRRVAWLLAQSSSNPRAGSLDDRSATRRDTRADDVAWAVTVAARYVPGATCLTQALAAQWLLARFGCPARLQIGVAKAGPDALRAHAWLERDGRVILGGEPLEDHSYAVLPVPDSR